jgi:hypothetical protein
MCCGHKRLAMRTMQAPRASTAFQKDMSSVPKVSALPAQASGKPEALYPVTRLRYVKTAPLRVRGAITGRLYEFSSARSVQTVNAADGPALLRSGLFRQT